MQLNNSEKKNRILKKIVERVIADLKYLFKFLELFRYR